MQRNKQTKKQNNNNLINTNLSCYWELRNVKFNIRNNNNDDNLIQQ
jgi:hypothetical protein